MSTFHEELRDFFALPHSDVDLQSIKSMRDLASNERKQVWRLYFEARLAREEKHFDDAIRCCDELLSEYGTSTAADDQEPVARALLNKGVTLEQTEKPIKAIAVFDELLQRFGDASETALKELVAKALLNKGVALGKSEKPIEEIAVYDELLQRFGDASETALKELVAKALLNKGVTLGKSEKPIEEIAVYNELLKRFGDASETALKEPVAKALLYKGVTLGKSEKPIKAIAVFDDLLKRFGDASEPALKEQVAKALLNKGVTLGQLEKPTETIAVFDELLKRFGDASEPALKEQVAKALLNKGVALGQSEKPIEEIAAYDELLKRFGDASEPALKEQVAGALLNKGVALGQSEKPIEEIAAYDELLKRFGDASESALKELVAKALRNKGVALGQLEKPTEAIIVFDELLKRFGYASEPALEEPVATALLNKGVALGQSEKLTEAIAVCNELLQRFGDASEPKLKEQVAKALRNKGVALGQLEKLTEAIIVFDELIKRFEDASEPKLKEQVAKALLNKGVSLEEIEKPIEAIAVYDELLQRFGNEEETSICPIVDFGRVCKAQVLKQIDDPGAPEAKDAAIEATKGNLKSNLKIYLGYALEHFDEKTQKDYFQRMKVSKNKTTRFLVDDSEFADDESFLLVLREWNSYTPTIPSEEESDRGGGYYIRHSGTGIVIDPGYDFIGNFFCAGGKICDIDHIIVTHAHDDHTAELESLLMLLHQANDERKSEEKETLRVSLYLSQGCERKFSGLIPSKNDSRIKRHITLSCPGPGCSQRVELTDKVSLTVLPAYHDDVLTRDTAIGLGFEFKLDEGDTTRVVFTSDTGCYPRRFNPQGEPQHYVVGKDKRPKLDTSDEMGIYNQYPEQFKNPHLLVAHIGSIQKSEFNKIGHDFEKHEEGEWYYANHLGMLGTLTVLDKLSPKAAIISEFGSELKGFQFDLVEIIARALHDKQSRDKIDPPTFVVPGDLTVAYYIANRQFLCHSDSQPHPAEELICRRAADWKTCGRESIMVPDITRQSDNRTYLFLKDTGGDTEVGEASRDKQAQDFHRNRYMKRLPHHKPQGRES